ncbi:MAG TPA: DUF11 domain-containing protein [Anaerolineae bacterium]|nr:DUF11 domain-containing protein [Anaerolineae bacterium]
MNVRSQVKRQIALLLSMGLALVALLVTSQLMAANERVLPPDLGSSYKMVDREIAVPGTTLRYTIVISNSGDDFTIASLTDSLPEGTHYVPGSLSASEEPIGMGEMNGVITWTDFIDSGDEIHVTFQAMLTDTLTSGTWITNTVYITGTEGVNTEIMRMAATEVVTSASTSVMLPIVYVPVPMPTITSIDNPRSDEGNSWTVYWNNPAPSQTTGFQLQESNSSNFDGATTIDVAGTSSLRAPAASWQNVFYYRVRAVGDFGEGPWSNVAMTTGDYFDTFDNANSGWAIRRQDTDDVDNQVYYRNDSTLVLEMDSRWDYQIASSMKELPEPPYRIKSRVRLEGVDNLHTYGFVFGADWDGTQCPNSEYTSCFNQYYRLLNIWSGAQSTLKMQLKRIDYHDYDAGNAGRGADLISVTNVQVNSPSETDQEWAIEVWPSGDIYIFANGNMVGQSFDPYFINNRYFGFWSSTDEYTGLEAVYDWVEVIALEE